MLRHRGIAVAQAGLALVCAFGLRHVALRYEGFPIPYGFGIQEVPPQELVFYLYLLCFGVPATLLLAAALQATSFPGRCVEFARSAAGSPWLPFAVALAVGAAALVVRRLVLLDAPVSDDEATYAFIAQTLLEGRVTNPSPGDLGFFVNQFIILDDASWYGKYPIGHPAFLALGEAVGLRALVVPLVTAASAAMTFAVGRRVASPGVAALGAGLLLVSPQFVFTGATQLSQPTSGLCMLVGLWALLVHEDTGRLRFAVLSGVAWGVGILVRPLPGALFLLAAGGWLLVRHRSEPLPAQVRRALSGALPVLAAIGLLMWVQQAQTGSPTQSGYHTLHGGMRGSFRLEWVAPSVAGSLLRQNAWLFGWALSFAFLPFAKRSPRIALLWCLVGAEYSYRVLFPKTVVAATGPIYVAEIVPLLALLTASGMVGLAGTMSRLGIERARERVAAVAIAATVVSAWTFLPFEIRSLHRSGASWQAANRLLDANGAESALVFADFMIDPASGASWAYYPPNPSPRLDDRRLFVRIPKGAGAREAAHEFWQERFPERSAWVFQPGPDGGMLAPLAPPAAADDEVASRH